MRELINRKGKIQLSNYIKYNLMVVSGYVTLKPEI